MIAAEEMIDKCKDKVRLQTKVHQAGGVIGRPELDDPEADEDLDD